MFSFWSVKTFSPSATLYYYSLSNTFFKRIVAGFRKQYSEKITECSDSCIHNGMTYPIDDLWIGSLILADITEQFFRNYCAIFSERTRGTWDLDNDSFRYKSFQLSTSSITFAHHLNERMGINRIHIHNNNFRWNAAISVPLPWRICGMSRYFNDSVGISICEDSIALLKGVRTKRAGSLWGYWMLQANRICRGTLLRFKRMNIHHL